MPSVAAIVSGPVHGGARGWAFGGPVLDTGGYRHDEFFLQGVAAKYRPAATGPLAADGRWGVVEAGRAPYRTRLIVVRPVDPGRFSGTVILVWNNVSLGADVFTVGETSELVVGGHAVVGVTAQRAGVHGAGDAPIGLRAWDADRYGSLSIPSDDYSFDIFTQAARAVGADRAVASVDPLDGLDVRHVIAFGVSQSAGRLATYLNAVQPESGALDGVLLGLHFGKAAAFEVGDRVVTTNDVAWVRHIVDDPGQHVLRDDLVPVVLVNSELEAQPYAAVRQPDSDLFRWWEIAGTAHTSVQVFEMVRAKFERDFGQALPAPDARMNRIWTRPVMDAAMHGLRRWVAGGPPLPMQPRLELSSDRRAIVRDPDGIARGGIRLPGVDVPIACNSAIPATDDPADMLSGSCRPFDADTLLARYGDRAGYLDAFEESARAAMATGVLLPRDVEALITEAGAAWPLDG